MSVFDIIFFIILLIAAISGLRSGIVRQLIGFAGLFIALWCAYKLSALAAGFWANHFNTDPLATKAILFIVFQIVLFALMVKYAGMFSKMVNMSGLGWLNRLLGMVFATLQVLVIFGAFAYACSSFKLSEFSWLKKDFDKSLSYKPLTKVAEAVFPYMDFDRIKLVLPNDIQDHL